MWSRAPIKVGFQNRQREHRAMLRVVGGDHEVGAIAHFSEKLGAVVHLQGRALFMGEVPL